MALEDALGNLLKGLGLVGSAITYLIKLLFSAFGIDIPDWAIQIATIIVLIISLLGLGSKLNKVILVILIFILVSCGAGLLSGLLHIG
jgi:hypothetical protein